MRDPIVLDRLVDTAPEDLRAKQAELELRILDDLDDWGSARLYVLAGSVNATAHHVNRALQHLRQAGAPAVASSGGGRDGEPDG